MDSSELFEIRFTIQQMTNDSAMAIADWIYTPPYDFYNAVPDDPDLADFLNPEFRHGRYYETVAEYYGLVGFFEFKHEKDPLEIGLGLRPDLTGKGLGLRFVQAGMAFARSHFGVSHLCLTVATFNQRAITVYERAGFRPVTTYMHHTNGADYEFLRMISELATRIDADPA